MSKLFVRFVKTPQLLLVSSNAVAKAPAVRCCSAFKSSIHTDNIYPGTTLASKYAQFDVTKLPTKEHVFSGYIPMNEVQFSYTLSSGAGGQNVQKVKPNLDISFRGVSHLKLSSLLFHLQNSTKVELRFHLDSASWLGDDVKSIIKMNHGGQLTKDGHLVVKSDRTRSRQLNQADTLQKLRHFIWAAVDQVKTYLERTQISEVEAEKRFKAQQKAARQRVKEKRDGSMLRNHRRVLE